jgi:hypothetical protein
LNQPFKLPRVLFDCMDATRVLVLQHLQDDTYVIIEGGEVSLSSGETLREMINDLSGRSTP